MKPHPAWRRPTRLPLVGHACGGTDLGLPLGLAVQLRLDLGGRIGVGAARHGGVDAVAQHLVALVAGQIEEAVIGENDQILGS